MTKDEVFELMSLIDEYYDCFSPDQRKINAWYEALKKTSFEELKQNLVAFAKVSPVPPKVSDLIRKKTASSRDIPNVMETMAFLSRHVEPAKEEVVQQELAKMREILGIRRR